MQPPGIQCILVGLKGNTKKVPENKQRKHVPLNSLEAVVGSLGL